MKALTVQQPWATAIVHWGKSPENRSRNIAGAYLGPLAIHAGLREDESAYDDDMIREALGTYDDSWRLLDHLETRGAIIGVVDLVAVHHHSDHGLDRCSPWAQSGDLWHLVLERPRALEVPVPCRGALGLWNVPSGVDDQVQLQLPPAASDEPDPEPDDPDQDGELDHQQEEFPASDAADGVRVHGAEATR